MSGSATSIWQKFPPLDLSETSSVIRRCWYGSFDTIQRLLAAIMALEEGKKQTARAMSAAVIRKQQRVCTQLVDKGILSRILTGCSFVSFMPGLLTATPNRQIARHHHCPASRDSCSCAWMGKSSRSMAES